jgi:hypothetical protein
VIDPRFCPKCSSPVLPGETSCSGCGAPLPGRSEGEAGSDAPVVPEAAAPESKRKRWRVRKPAARETAPVQASTEAVAEPAAAPDGLPIDPRAAPTADPRLAAPGQMMSASAVFGPSGEPRPRNPIAPPVHMPANWHLDLQSMVERPAAPEPPIPEPTGDATGHIPGGYLAPSATYRGSGWAPLGRDRAVSSDQPTGPSMGVSIGAVPISSADIGSPLATAPRGPGPLAAMIAPAPAMIAPAAAMIALSAPAIVAPPIPQPGVATAAPQRTAIPTAAQPARKESAPELVAFGFVAAGGVVGFASLFLPWAGSAGIGIGTVASAGSLPQPNQWAWGMPAAIPLLLLTGLVLGAAAGSDRAQQRLPSLAFVIGRVTDVILPMLLGGLYLGVGLLYVTLPPQFGFGTGIIALIAAGCLLLAGSIVALFFPPGNDSVAG